MDLYETELPDAKARLAAMGRNPEDYSFEMEFLPPDPDGIQSEIAKFDKDPEGYLRRLGF